jgi:uncharacterized protein (TIGR02145 family)
MAENLAFLPTVSPSSATSNTISYYYVYGYEGTNVNSAKATENYATYGVLYNWPAAMSGAVSSSSNPSGVKGVCPNGWHLPSAVEWTTLTNYLGRENVAGGKMKEIGTIHWISPNTGATNSSGFTALPSGFRSSAGNFYNISNDGRWWSSTEYSTSNAWYRRLNYSHEDVHPSSYYDNEGGFSVRCVKD